MSVEKQQQQQYYFMFTCGVEKKDKNHATSCCMYNSCRNMNLLYCHALSIIPFGKGDLF